MSAERQILCPKCQGSKYQPSALVTVREWCTYCEGQGYFMGRPQRLPTIAELNARLATNSKDSSNG